MLNNIRDSVEESIKHGVEAGRIDPKRDAASLAMIRYMADTLDRANEDETVVLRYVSPASFLSYCEKLGFLPNEEQKEETPKFSKNAKLHVVGQSKWKKTG